MVMAPPRGRRREELRWIDLRERAGYSDEAWEEVPRESVTPRLAPPLYGAVPPQAN